MSTYTVHLIEVSALAIGGPFAVVAFDNERNRIAASVHWIETRGRAEQVAAEYRRVYPAVPS